MITVKSEFLLRSYGVFNMNYAKTPSVKPRDYLFDNYKTLLISLVVMGHFIEPCYQNNDFLYTLKWLIVSFHMPAFIFISGYFSKRELPFSVIVRKLLIPYIVYEFIYYFFYIFVLHKETGLHLLYPKFSLWYLLALFVWRTVTPYVKKCPYYMPAAITAGLLIGLSGMQDNYLSLPRILYFYPFFLAGINFNRGTVTKFGKTYIRVLSAAGIAVFTVLIAFAPVCRSLSVKICYGRYNYDFLEQDMAEGILCRAVCYTIGFAMTFAVMMLIPERRTFCSYIGTRTMAIYLFHGLTYSYLKECTAILKNITSIPASILLLGGCTLLTVIFSVPKLTAFTNKVADLKLPAAATQTASLYFSFIRHWLRQKYAALRCFLYTRKVNTNLTRILFYGGRF